ncbi:MAG: hypothetical protein A4E47_00946 [Methanosaeta sp. PtaU1.Bin028]|nr:MAG: hypothetical protein A4E47_00946 [Methanosaeta sp. PtaU1.Bin028]
MAAGRKKMELGSGIGAGKKPDEKKLAREMKRSEE